MNPIASPHRTTGAFVLLSVALLALTLGYHIPLPLWDHLDLIPIYKAWQEGTLGGSEFWRVHDGSHLHSAAYVVLLATTYLSGGQPWLDCVVSWCLLVVIAWLVLLMARRTVAEGGMGWKWWGAFLFLALYPGHLVNLQWGWQVAVFISSLGAVAPICVLTRRDAGMASHLVGLALAVAGVLAFTTTLAVFPIAICLVLMRQDLSLRRRAVLAVSWGGVLLALAAWLGRARVGSALPPADVVSVGLYTLNYLGGGVLRFASALAPLWALLALAAAAISVRSDWSQERLRPWLALMAFGIGCALLTALGRASTFGASHAFVTRYVSFASLFWIGWLGVMFQAAQGASRNAAWKRWLVAATLLFAVANGMHMVKKARDVHDRAQQYATHLRDRYPHYDSRVLDQAYDQRASVATQRLQVWRDYGFAPFTGSPPRVDEAQRARNGAPELEVPRATQ